VNAPPIQLLDYVVEQFHFDAPPVRDLPEKDATESDRSDLALNLEVRWDDPKPTEETSVGEARDASIDDASGEGGGPATEVFPLDLVIRINDEDEFEERLFTIRLVLAGLFVRIAPGEDDSAPDDYLVHTVATGISMLYGSARQIVSSMTSQSHHDKILLPAISPFRIAQRVVERKAKPPESDA
jgi:hypothetical protein